MSNYDVEIDKLSSLLELSDGKEPRDIALICRQVLEKAIDLIFQSKNVRKPVGAQLLELINNDTVQNFLDSDIITDQLHFVRILGINAHHDLHIKKNQANLAYDNTEFLLAFLKEKLGSSIEPEDHSDIDANSTDLTFQPKAKKSKTKDLTEFQTRKIYIDTYLGEAGWKVCEPNSSTTLPNGIVVKSGEVVPSNAGSEIPVKGLNNATGIGFCDYVLYDEDGKPLAIVEAKKTTVDPNKGIQQVREYGACMKNQYGYTPILYYTNGYEINIIDGKYPSRKVAAFHTLQELRNLINRRNNQGIKDMSVNRSIAGRPYQTMAITSMCERFNQMKRRGLLVMATGTGKTRTAIALVELLTRNNFIKNVLFLADRTSLVAQAFKNFKNLLPDMTYCILNDKGRANDPNARITFSTHQTMINYIDDEKKGEMTVGRFDLIIIDEAHRSIFNKYGAIFSYFDSLLVGLTATPKDEVDANTYQLFDCESGVPNFSYSLTEAINEHYLVPYKLVNRTSKQLKDGINYDDLSDLDKIQVNLLSDEYFEDGDVIQNSKLFRKIFNKDTCRRVLEDLMEKGLRVEQGEVLGKSIIFAVNHYHAQMIVETFNEMYPMYPDYCKLIDNQIKNSDNLIGEFEDDSSFRIAVSVDMLDTGIDVPSVLNLVFFKRVRSNIKLIQMIGRGTRLCPNLLDGQDKKYFLIFDYFNNLKDDNPESIKPPVSVSQKIFGIRLKMLCEMQTAEHQMNAEHCSYYNELKYILLTQVQDIKKKGSERISVRAAMKTLDQYDKKSDWEYIGVVAQHEIEYAIQPLIQSDTKDDYLSLSFDYKMLQIEEKLIADGDLKQATNLVKSIRFIAQVALSKASIAAVNAKLKLFNELYVGDVWNHPTITKIEYYRKELRNVIPLLKEKRIIAVMIDNADQTEDGEEIEGTVVDIRTYKEKVIDYLKEHSDNPTIKKIKNLEPLNEDDFKALEDLLWVKLGDRDDYYSISKLDNIAAFIRSIVGVDQKAINEKFSQYINENSLSAEQMDFIHSIINYVQENGDITGKVVVNEAPFDNYSIVDLFDDNAYIVANIVKIFHNCIERA